MSDYLQNMPVLRAGAPAEIRLDRWDDWAELRVAGVLVYDAHEVPEFVWIELLQKLGHRAKRRFHDEEYPDDGFDPAADPGGPDDDN